MLARQDAFGSAPPHTFSEHGRAKHSVIIKQRRLKNCHAIIGRQQCYTSFICLPNRIARNSSCFGRTGRNCSNECRTRMANVFGNKKYCMQTWKSPFAVPCKVYLAHNNTGQQTSRGKLKLSVDGGGSINLW